MSLTDIVLRLSLAILLGAVIGFDRELKQRPAGLRTHILISLAAALFTIIAFEIHDEVRRTGGQGPADPLRAIEAVTAGVAFLATGGIIVARGQVVGITTGAAMWLAGAVGVACGAGIFRLALLATGMALLVLAGLILVERFLNRGKQEPAAKPAGEPTGASH